MVDSQITLHNLIIGKLSCVLYKQQDTSLAILVPPHPKHCGNSDNITIKAIRNAFLKNNFSVLIVNLHVYEESKSYSDDFHTKDVLQTINWANKFFPYINHFWIGGVSFGSWVAINLAMRRPEFTGFLCAGLPTKLYDFSFFISCAVPNLIIQADGDITSDILNKKMSDSSFAKKVNSMNFCILEGETYKMNSPKSIKTIVDTSYSFIKKSILKESLSLYLKHKSIGSNQEEGIIDKSCEITNWRGGDMQEGMPC